MPDDHDAEVAEWQAIGRRDEVAFTRWLARCEIRLRRSLRRFARVVDVEAVLQDTAIQIWEHDAVKITPTGRTEFLLRWAYVVARNKALNVVKRAGRQVPLEMHSDLEPSAMQAHGDPLLRNRIHRCLQQLLPHFRCVLDARLKDEGQHPDRELAGSLGVSFDAFRQNLARGRRALEGCLKTHGIDVRTYLQ